MKRIKLGIKTSENMNYTYNVYRSTSQQDLPDSLEVLSQLNPLMVVQESLLQKEATNVQEDITPDKSKAPRALKTPYKLSYDPLCSSIHNFVLSIKDIDTQVLAQYNIKFNNSGVIQSVTETITDGSTVTTNLHINGDFEILGSNIFIAETLLNGHKAVSASYYIKVINVYDDNEKLYDGIDYNGPVATGLSKPSVVRDIQEYQVAMNTKLPTFKIVCSGSDQGVVYYYRIVAEDTIGNVSEPSPLFSMLLKQNPANIIYKLEGSFDVGVKPDDEVVWKTLLQDAHHNIEYIFGQPGTAEFDSVGPIVPETVPAFNAAQVNLDTSHVVSDNTLQIAIPNVWMENTPVYNSRKTLALRAIATDMFGNISDISDIVPSVDVDVPIERMVIVKKDVSMLVENQAAPVALDDANATIIKDWVKVDGRYYDASVHTGFPTNLQLTNSPICLMTTESTFNTLITVDDSVAAGQILNYTIHIFDAYGKVATVSKVVDTTVTP